MTAVSVRGLVAGYGGRAVLGGLDLEVPAGAFAAVLGASGSGKTTLLRVLAGFLRPDAGTVGLGGSVVAAAGPDGVFVPPERRRIGIVPQEGALFPHLSVGGNVGFGVPRGSRARIAEVLDLVGMSGYERARPHELSGGQQQRVALARALAPRPRVVLLDEPFTSLDAGLRSRIRSEVRELLRSLGTTAVLVTHDQDEALSTADLVAVLRAGRIVQCGSPQEVYDSPADLEVARFVGDAVELPAAGDSARVRCALGEIAVRPAAAAHHRGWGPATVVLRPEQLLLAGANGQAGGGTGVVRESAYFGHDCLLRVELADGTRVPVRVAGGAPPPAPGTEVVVSVAGAGLLFDTPRTAHVAGAPHTARSG